MTTRRNALSCSRIRPRSESQEPFFMEYNTTMETDTIKRLLIVIAAMAAAIGISYLIGRRDGRKAANLGDSVKVDTLVVFDTITQYEPIVEERIKLEKILVPVAKTDTLWMHDTLLVYLEREQLVWQDSLSRIYASGIFPQIDSVEHFVKDRIVTIEKSRVVPKPCRWSIGIQAGYGVTISGSVKAAPYLGIGVSYNLLSW